jgi:hypothetical protein
MDQAKLAIPSGFHSGLSRDKAIKIALHELISLAFPKPFISYL